MLVAIVMSSKGSEGSQKQSKRNNEISIQCAGICGTGACECECLRSGTVELATGQVGESSGVGAESRSKSEDGGCTGIVVIGDWECELEATTKGFLVLGV